MNRAFLESAHGPDFLAITGPGALDDVFPTMPDNGLYLALLSHFQFMDCEKDCLLFQRKNRPAKVKLDYLDTRTVAFGEVVPVPVETAPIWMEIDITPNLAGKLLSAAFKPCPVYMTSYYGRDKSRNRLIPKMGKAGFLLSPYLRGRSQMQKFYAENGGPRVDAVRIETTQSIEPTLFFQNKIAVHYYSIRLEE